MDTAIGLVHSWLVGLLGRAERSWSSAHIPTRLYVVGFGVVLVGGLVAAPTIANPFATIGATILASGFVIEAYRRITVWLEQLWGKLVGALTVAAVVPIAVGLASNIVNVATGQDPTNLPYATAVMTPLTAGYFVAASAVLLLVLTLSIGLIAALLSLARVRRCAEDPNREDREAMKVILRLIAVICLSAVAQAAWRSGQAPYERGLQWAARTAAFTLDTYSQDPCRRSPQERIKRLNDDVVIVARSSADGPEFFRRSCPISTLTNTAP